MFEQEMSAMKLRIDEAATTWYKNTFEPSSPIALRFYVRYGFGGHIPGFSLAIKMATPENPIATAEKGDMLFFVEESDAWYFEEKDLHIKLDENLQEPTFLYE